MVSDWYQAGEHQAETFLLALVVTAGGNRVDQIAGIAGFIAPGITATFVVTAGGKPPLTTSVQVVDLVVAGVLE